MKSNPAETVELGATVMFALGNEEDSIEATHHYDSCTLGDWDGFNGCQFCMFGPIPDMREMLRDRINGYESSAQLGDPWYF